MVSATTQRQNVEEGINAGANDYIGKPFQKPELLQKIDAQLKEQWDEGSLLEEEE